MELSVVIPAYNEAENLPHTLRSLYTELSKKDIPHEIIVINDNSKDNTLEVLQKLQTEIPTLIHELNPPPHNGFGYAIRKGLDIFKGDCVAIFMADLSDSPTNLIEFYNVLKNEEEVDCIFGSRFIKDGSTDDYPLPKLILNRIANNIIRFLFGIRYNDCTNAFKLYRKRTIQGLGPLLSPHFNLTVELPLKAIIRGYKYKIMPNTWRNRVKGVSKLRIREMGSRYLFIVLYCLIEKYFSKGDYLK